MNIHDVARTLVLTERALSELTDMSARDRMEFIAALQLRLIDDQLNRSDAVPSSADSARPVPQVPETGRGFQLRAWTADGKESLPDILRRLLETSYKLPHTGDL